ncbi:hypothetical protein [Lentilactobacillus hilgardii]|uniref:Uncharacterized protein n=1 Tax=Lentilactobacillus hilgardii TaxID=1588 RepID=A0A6P1E0U4_LENHI|nr:hypothetical protein [Lentilactobacillus hilgardii]MCV3740201.1 hypothetical protein [Lentilactobacillus hilgardii]QHB50906.1 hypothetical protein GQR93_01050 [Lentilactobacillus hilgardii]
MKDNFKNLNSYKKLDVNSLNLIEGGNSVASQVSDIFSRFKRAFSGSFVYKVSGRNQF